MKISSKTASNRTVRCNLHANQDSPGWSSKRNGKNDPPARRGLLATAVGLLCVLLTVSASAGDTKSGFMPSPDTLIGVSTTASQTKLAVSIQTKSDCAVGAESRAAEDAKTTETHQTAKTVARDKTQPSQQQIKVLSYYAFYDHTGKTLSEELIDEAWTYVSAPVLPERNTKSVHHSPRIAKRGQSWLYRALLDPTTLDIIDAGWILVTR